MCDNCEWEELLDDIDELIDSDNADWCMDTLEGIRETVVNMEHCTERQRDAIDNIAAKVNR